MPSAESLNLHLRYKDQSAIQVPLSLISKGEQLHESKLSNN
jgi:hypothetical protein